MKHDPHLPPPEVCDWLLGLEWAKPSEWSKPGTRQATVAIGREAFIDLLLTGGGLRTLKKDAAKRTLAVFAAVGALTMVGTVLTSQVYDLRMRPAEGDDEDCEPPAEATASPDEPVGMEAGEAVEQTAIRPIPLSERRPGPKDCLEGPL